MKPSLRRIVNICIVIGVFGSWIGMTLFGDGALALNGLRNLRYFTMLSNIFAGIAAIMWLVRTPGSNGGDQKEPVIADERTERVKYIAACSVGLTFTVVMVFLGPLYGYLAMFSGANLFLHLVIPLMAMGEIIFLSGAEYTKRDNLLAVIPPLIYGLAYLANILINGMGEWPDTNDWYLFFAWGYPVGAAIYVIIIVVTWLIGFGMRKAQRRHRKA